jgi:8-oxo-dGTP pyrophosphatase MutT (NUDIX family)
MPTGNTDYDSDNGPEGAKGAHVIFYHKVKTRPERVKDKSKDVIDEILVVLLAKRTQDAPTHPGLWSPIGGKVDPDKGDKTPKDTAAREVDEELDGTKLTRKKTKDRLKYLQSVMVTRKNGPCWICYFSMPLRKGMHRLQLKWDREHHKVEGEGLAWFTAEEIHHLPMRPEDRIAVNTFFERHGV